jgi:branched-chain amino acid transport system substrate-binding protein
MVTIGRLLGVSFVAGLAMMVMKPASADDASQTGLTDTTIKIGMFAPLTGPLSAWGYPVVHGAEAVYKEANKNGGIHGRKIVVVTEDAACDPTKAIAAAKKLIFDSKVFLLNGGVCSTATIPTIDDVVANKVPDMLLTANVDSMVSPDKKWVFRAFSPASLDGKVIANFIKTNPKIKRVAVIAHPDEWGQTKVDALIATLKGTPATVVANEAIGLQATDATAQVLKMKGANPDAIVLMVRPTQAAIVLRTAIRLGLRKPALLNGTLSDLPDLLKKVGDRRALDDAYAVGVFKGPLDSPQMKPWVDMLHEHFPQDKVQISSFWGTAGAIAVVEALRRAGPDLTREKFVAALESINDLDAGPMVCRLRFSKDNHDGCVEGTMLSFAPGTEKVIDNGMVWKTGQ